VEPQSLVDSFGFKNQIEGFLLNVLHNRFDEGARVGVESVENSATTLNETL
jgi:hypothetical protein